MRFLVTDCTGMMLVVICCVCTVLYCLFKGDFVVCVLCYVACSDGVFLGLCFAFSFVFLLCCQFGC